MSDYLIRATACNEEVRAFAINSKDLVEEARASHMTSPVVTAAMGRLLTGAAMMGSMMKGDKDLLTLQVLGSGPVQGITVTADSHGRVKGFPNVPIVEVPPKYEGKLDVGAAIGVGVLRVIRDTGLKEPYVGTVELKTGEIAEDLTYYFAQSEQTPSAVGLGVLVDTDYSVRAAGGFIIQLMPNTSDETISKLEENLKKLPTVTSMFDEGKTPEEVLGLVLDGMDFEITEKSEVAFECDCSRERVQDSIASIAKDDIQEMIDEGKPVEVRCQFCNKKYDFTIDDLKEML